MVKTLQSRIVSGSVVLLTGSALTTALNLAYNIVIARFLGPKSFGHATVVYTLLILLSAVSLAFQIVSTKVVAQQRSPEGKAAVYRVFHKSAWGCGLFAALALSLFQREISDYLNLGDPILVALIAIGAAFYIPLGSRRGYVQGNYEFAPLATNLVLEGMFRLGGSFLLILSGFGVRGVIAANAAAMAVAYFAITPRLAKRSPNPLRFWPAFREACQAMFFFAGQILINNCDIVLVKHLFPAREAGLYAAIALVGRVMSTLSSAVVNSTFPIVAGTGDEERKDLRVIATSLLLVLGIGAVLAVALWITPARIWTSLLGPGFQIAGRYDISYLSSLYALKTVVYSLSAVIITFEMSYKIANTSWVQLMFSGLLIAGIYQFHSSIHQVILVQLVLLSALFIVVAIQFLISSLSGVKFPVRTPRYRPVSLIRRVSEDEVIAEFLKGDSSYPESCEYQKDMHETIFRPNLNDAGQNAKRRALLLTKHLSLWKEIPAGTEWHEVEVNQEGLEYIRVFPRAHWRKLARGDFSVTSVAAGLRANLLTLLHANLPICDDPFISKIAALRDQLVQEDVGSGSGTVILLGVSQDAPLTVLDGNHRLVAATLSSPHCFSKLRFICGLSPRMTQCCWYETNAVALLRYARNVLGRAILHPKSELERLMHDAGVTARMADTRKAGTRMADTQMPGTAAAALTSVAETNDAQP